MGIKTISNSKELIRLSKLLNLKPSQVCDKITYEIEKHGTIEVEDRDSKVIFLLDESSGIDDPYYWSLVIFGVSSDEVSELFSKLIIEINGYCLRCGSELEEHVFYNYILLCATHSEMVCPNCN